MLFFLSQKGERSCVLAVFFTPVLEKEILNYIADGSIIQVSTILIQEHSTTPATKVMLDTFYRNCHLRCLTSICSREYSYTLWPGMVKIKSELLQR